MVDLNMDLCLKETCLDTGLFSTILMTFSGTDITIIRLAFGFCSILVLWAYGTMSTVVDRGDT